MRRHFAPPAFRFNRKQTRHVISRPKPLCSPSSRLLETTQPLLLSIRDSRTYSLYIQFVITLIFPWYKALYGMLSHPLTPFIPACRRIRRSSSTSLCFMNRCLFFSSAQAQMLCHQVSQGRLLNTHS